MWECWSVKKAGVLGWWIVKRDGVSDGWRVKSVGIGEWCSFKKGVEVWWSGVLRVVIMKLISSDNQITQLKLAWLASGGWV